MKQNKWRWFFSHRWRCLWMCANAYLSAFMGRGRAAGGARPRSRSHLAFEGHEWPFIFTSQSTVAWQRTIFRGANPGASVAHPDDNGSVTKHTLPSCVHSVMPSKFLVAHNELDFMKDLCSCCHLCIFRLLVGLVVHFFVPLKESSVNRRENTEHTAVRAYRHASFLCSKHTHCTLHCSSSFCEILHSRITQLCKNPPRFCTDSYLLCPVDFCNFSSYNCFYKFPFV